GAIALTRMRRLFGRRDPKRDRPERDARADRRLAALAVLSPARSAARSDFIGVCWGGWIRTIDWLIQSQAVQSQPEFASFRANSVMARRAAGRRARGIR